MYIYLWWCCSLSLVMCILEDHANPVDFIFEAHRSETFRHRPPQSLEIVRSQIIDSPPLSKLCNQQIRRLVVVPK